MLRKEAGDSLFHAIIQQFYKEYGGKNADTDDFKRVSEDISGKNLSQFFKQWLYAEENPRLKISWKYKVADNTIRLTVKQLQQSTFAFPLEIFVQFTNGVSSLQRITINQKVETFALPAAERPLNIIADPNACLLFEGNITEEK
ncbi:MAG: hypothetical protein IPM85_08850 [Chitinophagaceae bacterium]|nr:hypothetical protein [Chitinophagaceae bacterium]